MTNHTTRRPVLVGLLRGLVYAVISAVVAFGVQASESLTATDLAPWAPVILLIARVIEAAVADERNPL